MKVTDPAGAHITRIYVNAPPRASPSPIRSSNSPPVCTSTPITPNMPSNPCPKEKMALLAKEIIATQRSSETFVHKVLSPPAMPERESVSVPAPPSPPPAEYIFISKQTRQTIDFTTGEGLSKVIGTGTDTVVKRPKKKRQTIAVVPPATQGSARSSKSSDDGDNLVPYMGELPVPPSKPKPNFTSYNGIQMFSFTLDDD